MLQVDELKTGRETTAPKIVGRFNAATPGAKYERLFWLFNDGSFAPYIAGGTGEGEGGAGDGSGGGGDGGAGTGAKDEVFNPTQQKAIDGMVGTITARHKTAMETASAASADIIAGLRSDIDELKGVKKGSGTGDDGGKGGKGITVDPADYKAMQDSLAELTADKVTGRKDKARSDLFKEVAKLNVRNPDQVTSLLFPYLKVADDGTVSIHSSDGAARINTDGTDMSVEGLVKGFLSDKGNSHFLNASSKGGSGSGSSMFNGDGGVIQSLKPGDIKNMSSEDFEKLRDDGISIPSSARPGLDFKFQKKSNPFAEARAAKLKKVAGSS